MRLIDADDVKKKIELFRDGHNYNGSEYEWGCYTSYDMAIDEIDDAPTVSAIIIPKDVTNGEMIEKLFPQLQIMADSGDKFVLKDNTQPYFAVEVDKGWWKDFYKGVEQKNKEELI